MVECCKFVNSRFNSNTYIISHTDFNDVWIVDPGDTDNIFLWLENHSKAIISGVLLTHAHFDHIYGINDILNHYSNCPIYVANMYGEELLHDAKKNGSRYTEEGPVVVKEEAHIDLYKKEMTLWPSTKAFILYTPGHSEDSVCILVDKMFFTGDTLIKDTRTVTKLKGGSEEKLKESISFFNTLKGNHLIVYPGHGDFFNLEEYDLNKSLFRKTEYGNKT